MDKVLTYQNLILDVLETYKNRFKKSSKDIQPTIVADRENNHFQFIWIGWNQDSHVYSVTTHLNIIDGKIWIHHDNTEVGMANLLVEKGIPHSDIVLGYFDPQHRKLTDFAA